jgi:hypothetical protein
MVSMDGVDELAVATNGVFGGVDRRIGIGIGILICASIIHSCQIL